ncbi:MAG: YbhB/YbcL family Raf kinase inhibitor-like protein [Nitrospiraceae bacterium]
MVRIAALAVVLAVVGGTSTVWAKGKPAEKPGIKVTSSDVVPNTKMSVRHVYKGFGCEGGNLSPALAWSDVPEGTKSFAITAYDPDAPTGSGWWHWVVYNIPAETREVKTGAGAGDGSQLPTGAVQGRTDFGSTGYGGPCPPPGHGNHRYQFTVHALKVEKLDLPADATAALIGFQLTANRLGKGTLTGLYSR